MEKFADVLDLAQAHTERETQIRIAAIQRRADSGYGSEYCIDCGEPIPAIRRQHIPNAKRCAACQDQEERRHMSVRRCCQA
jgi:phage/conjugal plasmid C-4 type zinc finger TraR family protein